MKLVIIKKIINNYSCLQVNVITSVCMYFGMLALIYQMRIFSLFL